MKKSQKSKMEGARGAEEKRRREDGRETSKRDGGASQLGDRTSEFETRAAEDREKKTETKENGNERPFKFQKLLILLQQIFDLKINLTLILFPILDKQNLPRELVKKNRLVLVLKYI